MRPSCLSAILRCRSFSLRGPSTISTPRAANTGRGLPAPNGASDATPAATPPVIAAERQVAVDPQPRHQVVGPERLVGDVVDARRGARGSAPRRASGRPPACGRRTAISRWRAALERAEHVEARDAAARAVRDAVLDRQHDRRPVKRVDQLRRDDADDAAVPAFAGDDEDRCARRRRDRSATIFFAAARISASSSWRRTFSPSSCSASAAHFVGHRFVVGQQQPRGDVGRAHAAGGVDARREHEADVIAVDRLAGQARRRRAARAGRPCAGPCVSRSSPSFAMTRFSPTSGTTSASVPIAATLMKPGSQLSRPAARHSACTSFSATPTPARYLSG